MIPLVLLTILLFNCSQKRALTAEGILNKSISYHDPNGVWGQFKGTFHFESSFSWNDSIPEALIISIDVANDYLRYQNLDRESDYVFHKDECKTLKGSVKCEDQIWIKNFYTYTWGLPMKLKDPGTAIKDTLITREFNNVSCYVLSVDYENEKWNYYMDEESFQLLGFDFIFKNKKKGETIYLSSERKVGKMRLASKRVWTDYYDGTALGTNELKKFEAFPIE